MSGKQFCGIYDINPAKFGQVANLRTQASHYGKMSEVFDGVDVTIGARALGKAGRSREAWPRAHGDRQLRLVIDSPSTAYRGDARRRSAGATGGGYAAGLL